MLRSWGRDFRAYTSDNIDATQILLEACRDAPLQRLVHASSSSVYGDAGRMPMREDAPLRPVSPYGATKLAAEHLCRLYSLGYGLPAVALRYFTVYGPRQRPDMAFHRFLTALRDGTPVALFGDGKQTRDFTFVADAVSATVAAGLRGTPGQVYNIGGGSRVSMNDALALMSRCTGRTADVRRQSAGKGDMRDTWADTTRARRESRVRSICYSGTRDTGGVRMAFRNTAAGMIGALGAARRGVRRQGRGPDIPLATTGADDLLFERGTDLLEDGDWRNAREHFLQIRDNYPQSPLRAETRLGIGDSLIAEGTVEAYVSALSEFRDFLAQYPTHDRADYAQYRLGMVYFLQMRRARARPGRDAQRADRVRAVPGALPAQSVAARRGEPRAGGRATGSPSRTSSSPATITAGSGIPAPRPAGADPERGPGLRRARRGLLPPGRLLRNSEREEDALEMFERLMEEFPQSEFAEEATQSLAGAAPQRPGRRP